MDKRYNILTHLYGEGPSTEPLRTLLKDEHLREEYQALSEAKFVLDHKDPARPAPETLDTIFTAAASQRTVQPVPRARLSARQDRQPARRRRFALLPVSMATAAVVVAVAVGLNVFSTTGERAMQPEVAATQSLQTERPQAALASRAGDISATESASAPVGDSMAAARLQVAASGAEAMGDAMPFDEDAVLAWDEADEVRLLHRRIQSLREANATLDWDEVGVPLEQLTKGPAGNSARGLQTVRAPRNQ